MIRRMARWLVFTSTAGTHLWRVVRNIKGRVFRMRLPEGTHVSWSAQVLGMSNVQLGLHTVIGDRTWLNVNDRQPGRIGIKIGSNCFIGRDNFFGSGKSIVLNDYCLTAKSCQFISSTHIYDDPSKPYVATGTTLTDSIYVGANCFLGAGASVIGHVKIGHGSVIGAGAVVRQDVPPFSLVVGAPAKVIKRFDFESKQWVPASSFASEHLIPNEADYLQQLKARFPKLDMPAIAAMRSEGEL